MKALESVAEAYAGGLLAILTAVAAVGWSKRALLAQMRRRRT